jgi:hypothetical protein
MRRQPSEKPPFKRESSGSLGCCIDRLNRHGFTETGFFAQVPHSGEPVYQDLAPGTAFLSQL